MKTSIPIYLLFASLVCTGQLVQNLRGATFFSALRRVLPATHFNATQHK